MDSTFGNQGIVITQVGQSVPVAFALLRQADGKLLAAGATGSTCFPCFSDFLLIRYLPDGTLDAGFGSTGVVTTTFGLNSDDSIAGLAVQPDGRIVVAGSVRNGAGCNPCPSADFGVARYLTNGTLDTSFGSGGRVMTDLAGADDLAGGIIVQADSKIVVAGSTFNYYPAVSRFALARYTVAGALDPTFGTGGIQTTAVGPYGSGAATVLLTAADRIVAAGSAGLADGSGAFALVRYLSNNDPNPSPTPTQTSVPVSATSTPVRTATVTATVVATTTPCLVQFSDVPPGSTFANFVYCLACRGIVGGYTDAGHCPGGTSCFQPGSPVTRGQLAKFIANAAGYTDAIPATRRTFTDVLPSDTFWIYIERVVAHGIVSGYSDGTYRAGNAVTRGQTAKFVSLAAGYSDVIPAGQQTFSDVPPSDVFWQSIERVHAHGVVGGYSDGTYRAGNAVSRGQTAKFIAGGFFPTCQAAPKP